VAEAAQCQPAERNNMQNVLQIQYNRALRYGISGDCAWRDFSWEEMHRPTAYPDMPFMWHERSMAEMQKGMTAQGGKRGGNTATDDEEECN